MRTVLRARRAIVDGRERPAAVVLEGARVVAVLPVDTPVAGGLVKEELLAADEVLLPGLVDTHVHVNEPGQAGWEGFAAATRAAAAGGITTIVDMPQNSLPPTLDVASLQVKRAAAAGKCHVDVAFWGGAVPHNLAELRGLHDAGVVGFTCFMVDSGVPQFPPLPDPTAAMRELASFGALLVAHAEHGAAAEARGRRHADVVASRPAAAGHSPLARLLDAARSTGARVHVVHLSSAAALPMLAGARADGVRVTVETCPHHLAPTAEEVPGGDTRFTCCPPVRGEDNREALWRGLGLGVIDMVVSDHSPCTPDLKLPESGGIASLQIALPIVWTQASARGHDLADVVRWMAAQPADLAGLAGKGRIAAGAAADLVVFAPEETFEVGELHHRNPMTPYAGRTLTGVVRQTWLAGRPVDDGEPRGRLLERAS